MNALSLSLGSPLAQTGEEPAFLGGRPRLERGATWPTCDLCHAQQTFFFQVDFPKGHGWDGRSLAVFACTRCKHQDFLIPEMLPGPLTGATVSLDFVVKYQRNFRFLVFPSVNGVLRGEGEPGVLFRPILMEPRRVSNAIGHLGGAPRWIIEDESPAAPFFFLMQLDEEFVFETTPEAPRAMDLDLRGRPVPSAEPGYPLFLANALYLFGAEVAGAAYVYALTQVD